MPEQNFHISPDSPWLAPLAGWSDLAFRLLCREEGASVTCTEMISAKGLVYGGNHTEDLLATCKADNPVVAQIFGAEYDFMEKGISILQERGFQYFDVNVGCSVAKVVKTGAGASMLRDIPNLLKVAEYVINQVHNPVYIEDIDTKSKSRAHKKTENTSIDHVNTNNTNIENTGTNNTNKDNPCFTNNLIEQKASQNINPLLNKQEAHKHPIESKQSIKIGQAGKIGFKIRLGYEIGHDVYIDVAKELESLGADWITLHPRYAKQSFSGVPQYQALARLKSAVKIPIIASGDLFSAEDGVRVILETGVDSVMYARGAMANPFIFKEHTGLWNHVQKEKLTASQIPRITEIIQKSEQEIKDELGKLINRHLKYAEEFNPHRALLQMRTIVPRYVKKLENAKNLRLALIACRSYEELYKILTEYFR